jgi:hypothetical protein
MSAFIAIAMFMLAVMMTPEEEKETSDKSM